MKNYQKELVMTLRNIELLSSTCVIVYFKSQDTFLHSLNVIKRGKPSNSTFTILALARFFLSTV